MSSLTLTKVETYAYFVRNTVIMITVVGGLICKRFEMTVVATNRGIPDAHELQDALGQRGY